MKKIKQITFELIPLLFIFIFLLYVKNEIAITILGIAVVAITFKFKYYKNEIELLVFGIIFGLFMECFASYVLEFQFWNHSLFLIPMWLPLAWGYLFIVMRRIGDIIIGK